MTKIEDTTLIAIEGVSYNVDKILKSLEITLDQCEFDDVKLLTPFDVDHEFHEKIRPMPSSTEYQYFCLNYMNDYFDTDYMLLIQSDSWVCNAEQYSPEFFNQYDYMGARWDFKDGDGSFGGSKRTNGNVGNGGFSWRSKKLMNLVQSYCKYEIVNGDLVTVAHNNNDGVFEKVYVDKVRPEDHVICRMNRDFLESQGCVWPKSSWVEWNFSSESPRQGDLKYENQFGFHGIYTDLSKWPDREKYQIPTKLKDWVI